MRIVVNDIAASNGGAITVLRDFATYIKAHDDENEWIFLLNDYYFEESDKVKIVILKKEKRSRIRRLLFDYFSGRQLIKEIAPDVVFSFQNTIIRGVKCKQVLYVQQAIPFQHTYNFSFIKKNERSLAVYQYIIGWMIKRSIRLSDKTIVQTEWMKKAILENKDIHPENIFVIPPDKLSVHKRYDVEFDNGYFFYPTSETLYKNNQLLINATKALKKEGFNLQTEMTLNREHEEGVNFIGTIQYEEVLERYKRGTLVFPSFIESFGLPLAEAKQIGTIILASDCEFSHEILYGYENAYFFNPFQEQELVELMRKVIEKEILLKSSFERTTNQVGSWEKVRNIILN